MLNIEYLKTLPSDEFSKVINRRVWCLKDNTCDVADYNCNECATEWLHKEHVEYKNIKGVIHFENDSLRELMRNDGIEPIDCVDCRWNVEAVRFTEFEDYILKFKSEIEGKFIYTKNGKKLMMEINDEKVSIKEYSATWADICKALKSAGIKDNNIIRKVHDELNVYWLYAWHSSSK